MRSRSLTILLAASALAGAPAAHAHGTGSHTGFASVVSTIEPPLPGLLVRVVGGHEQLSVTNLTKKRVVIFDEGGRPVADVAPQETEVWQEPRVGATEEPPERDGLVRNWRIAGEADGDPFVIVGFLGYRPPAEPAADAAADERELPAWAVPAAAVGGVLVLALALAVPFLRRPEPE